MPGRPTNLIMGGKGLQKVRPTVIAVGFNRHSFLFSFSLSKRKGPILTEILSQGIVKPKTTNEPILRAGGWIADL